MAALRRLLPRFSLRTLVMFLLLVTAGVGLWWYWQPWYLEHRLEQSVTAARFSHDGSMLAAASQMKTMAVWEEESGECLYALKPGYVHEQCIAFSPDDKLLAAGTADGTLWIWDGATGTCLQHLSGHGGRITSLAFSLDGRRLMSFGDDGGKAWDIRTGGPAGPGSAAGVTALRGPRAKIAADLEGAWKICWREKLCSNCVSVRAASPDGRRVLLGNAGCDNRSLIMRVRPGWSPSLFRRVLGATVLFAILFIWSVVRDRRRLARTG